MSRLILGLAFAGAALTAGYGSAQAQGAYYYDDPDALPPPAIIAEPPPAVGPQVYGYYQEDLALGGTPPVVELQRPVRPGGCGRYFYWNGMGCVDARNKPD